MSGPVHVWTATLTVNGVVTPGWERIATSFANTQPIGTARIDLPLPLPAHVVAPCTVHVTARMDGVPLAKPLFTGWFRDPDKNISASGNTASLLCEGENHRMTYPFETDVVYAGGARVAAITLPLGGDTYLHLGTQTVSWYADTSPDGTTLDKTFTPAIDSTFLWIAGRAHGTNSYDASIGDKKIKDHSKILVLQGGVELGRALFPVLSENWSGMLDYTNDANWSDFELYIACDPAIDASGGDVTVRFVSGHKPGSSDYDEYEVKAVTYQTAGRTSLRNIVRGLYKRAGFASGTYSVGEITDLSGAICYLGGNGKVDAGQVRMRARDTPIAFANRLTQMYGYSCFDCADGEPRCLPVRGVPSGTPQETFVEGASGFGFRTYTQVGKVYNAVEVTGANGTDSNRKKFDYAYATADVDVVANPAIPDPPGINVLAISNALLTSDNRCRQVGEIQEVNNSDQTFVEWETWPHGIAPGRVCRVTAPSIGIDGLLFVTSIRHDLSAQGFRCAMTGWKGVATPFVGDDPDVDDPNPTETDAEPTLPRPVSEWVPFKPDSRYST